jgi:hypothetical protein
VARFPLRLKKAKAAQEAAAKSFVQSDENLKQVIAARDQAKKTVEAAEAVAKSASPLLMEQSAAAIAASKAALSALEATVKAADELRKQSEAGKQAADKAAGDAEKAAAPQKIDYVSPAPVIALTVVPAPATFVVEVPDSGQVKKGASTDVKVTVKRQNEFAGPVTLALALPPGIAGLTADPVTVAADQTEGTLRINVSADAAEGDVVYPAIQTTSEQNGSVRIDVPVALKVIP